MPVRILNQCGGGARLARLARHGRGALAATISTRRENSTRQHPLQRAPLQRGARARGERGSTLSNKSRRGWQCGCCSSGLCLALPVCRRSWLETCTQDPPFNSRTALQQDSPASPSPQRVPPLPREKSAGPSTCAISTTRSAVPLVLIGQIPGWVLEPCRACLVYRSTPYMERRGAASVGPCRAAPRQRRRPRACTQKK